MVKIIANNKKAYFNFSIEDEIEAGISLLGSEVKAIRENRVNLGDGYVSEIKGELFLTNIMIGLCKGGSVFVHDERRNRKLLLHKKEIAKLLGKIQIKGYSLVPLKLYFKNSKIKVLLGLAKGKKLYDKRASIKERDEKRRAARGED